MNYRRHILSTLMTVVVLIGAVPVLADPPVDRPDGNDNPTLPVEQMAFAPDQVVIGFDERSYAETLLSSTIVSGLVASLDQSGVFLYQLADGQNPEDAADQLVQMGGATFAHPNYLLDELHPVQGSLAFSDQVFSGDFGGQPSAQILNLPIAHQVVTGDATKIAIIDGGIDFFHPGLEGQASSGYDFVDDDYQALDEPGGSVSGHGTFVAGITHLVAPEARIKAYRVMNAEGQGDGFSLAQAIERASLDGCDVINVSVVLTHQHLAVQAALEQAVARGSAVICAAGNDPTGEPSYPAAELSAIAVAAVDTDMKATDFTSYGEYVDLCAPGFEIYSVYQDPYFAWWSGTSFSTPFVTGQMALLRQRFPEADIAQLREILISTAQNVDDLNPDLAGDLGAGCINPIVSLYNNCCEMPGDIDGNGTPYDMADGATMDTAFVTGDIAYLGDCLGNADLTGDCRIDFSDREMLYQAIMGDTMPYLDCAECLNYMFDPGPSDLVNCCDQRGDLDGNGISYELDDAAILEAILMTGELGFRAVCLGNADITGDCRVDHEDLTLMVEVIAGQAVPMPECAACYSWLLVPGITRPDTAWVTPRYQAFEIQAGIDSTAPGSVYVGSSGDPQAFTVEVKGNQVVTLLTTEGMTNDDFSFEITVTPEMDSGLYIDTLVFDIEEVGNNPRIAVVFLALGCCTGTAQGRISPYAQAFGAPPNTPHTQVGSVYVTSTNAPANYRVEAWGSDFTELITTTGTTDDSLIFHVTTGSGLEPGVYIDTLAFYIDGTSASPNLALLFLQVKEFTGLDSAMVRTHPGEFFALKGEDRTQTGNLVVTNASGFPRPFTVANYDTPEFLHLLGSGGMTGEATYFEVTSTADMAPGVYVDTVISHVDSCGNSPVITPIYLYVDSTGGGVTGDSAWVYSLPGSFFDAPAGAELSQPGSLVIGAIGATKSFTVSHLHPGGFVQLEATAGVTITSVAFDIVSTGAMAAGVYVDSLMVEVEGVINSPLLHTIYLNITSDTLPSGNGDIEVFPDVLVFQAEYGAADSQAVYVGIHSSNQPANYTAFTLGWPPSFVAIPDSTGVTPDSLLVWIVSDGWNPGIHTDTIVIAVDGLTEQKAIPVTLEILGDEFSPAIPLSLANYPNPFNPTTEIVYTLPVEAEVTLRVYNILGREVSTLVEGVKSAGEHRIGWDGTDQMGTDVASGIYLYRLQAGVASATKKMILIR